jgi:patatin-like phospholipase/acyl hydrolase
MDAETLSQDQASSNHLENPLTLTEDRTLENAGYCLLSLDGGGVRGLSTLFILRRIMNRLNDARKTSGLDQVDPCDIFDLMGGTSTGG